MIPEASILECLLYALALVPLLGVISTSESNAIDARAGASDEANAASQGGIAADQSDESFAVSGFSTGVRDSGVNAFGSTIARDDSILNTGRLNTGLDLGSVGGSVTFNSIESDVAKAAISASQSVAQAATKTAADVLGNLSKSEPDKAQTADNKTLLYVVAALVLGFFTLVFFRK